jgi:PAS domain S-box-containing protein
MPMKLPGLSNFSRVVILLAFYFVGGSLGKESLFLSGTLSLVWPPAGIALAAILLFGYRFWPGVALGAILLTFWSGSPVGFFTWGTALGNTLGALACVFLLKRFIQFRNSMERVHDVAGFVVFACVVGTSVNAIFNVLSLCLSGHVPWANFPFQVIVWWVPNALAALVVAPLILTWGSPSQIRWTPKLAGEALLCATGLTLGTLISFNTWIGYGIENYPLAYLPYPFLVWGALRFGQRGATSGTFLVSALAIYSLLHKIGPFITANETESLTLIGSYIGILAIGNLLLAAAAAEREGAVRAVRESEKRYRAVVEDQTDLLCRFDHQGRITFVNRAYGEFYGKDPAELIGTPFMPSLKTEDREIPLSVFATLKPEQPSLSFDNKLLLPDGRLFWHQCTIHGLFDEQGRAQEFQAVIHDITNRKQLEETLREREEFFRLISENMTDLIAVLNREGRRLYNSPSYSSILGDPSKLIGSNSFAEIHPDDRETIERVFKETVSTGVGRRTEFRFVRPDGTVRFMESQGSIIKGKSSQPDKVLVVSRDITERLSLETKLRQSQKMEAIGRLAGGIAHDFNNLMQAIIGYTNLLLQRLPPNDGNRDTIQQIEKSADRAAALTSQLLAFSRKQVLKPKVFSVETIVADVNKLLRRLIGENIQLMNRSAQGGGYVCADPGQIEQVILNLSINARDAMPQGGTLMIETANVELTEKPEGFSDDFRPGNYVRLSVTDTGTGMTPEVKSHLFEPFFTTKGVGKGTGLGLSIVYGIVKQSGGEIIVLSDVGRGTTFQVFLPRVETPVTGMAAINLGVPPNTSGCETILLVEDEEIVRGMLAEVLRAQGYTVLEAAAGERAIEIAQHSADPIHLLITDMLMPQMNGSELAAKLLALRPGLPVLYISGYSDDEARRLGKIDQPAEFLQKPFRPDALLAKARQILDAQKNSMQQTLL